MSFLDLLMNKENKKIFEKQLKDKFINQDSFELEIERIVAKNDEMNYIDAIVHFCDKKEIDIENVSKLISKALKKKIEYDARQLNYLKKKKLTAKLEF